MCLCYLQQEQVLAELFDYVSQSPPPDDSFSTICTLKYLEACNKLFEKGLLSHSKIRGLDSEVLDNINQGLSFFLNWLESIHDEGILYKDHASSLPL